MANIVDAKIDEVTQQHTMECERLNVSRNVRETQRRIAEELKNHTKLDILASGYWGGLQDAAKVEAIRDAVIELAAKVADMAKKPEPAPTPVVTVVEAEEAPVKKKSVRATKGVALA